MTSLLITASGSSWTIYKAPSSGFAAMPLLSGETTAGSSPAVQELYPIASLTVKVVNQFCLRVLVAASEESFSAAGRIVLRLRHVKEMLRVTFRGLVHCRRTDCGVRPYTPCERSCRAREPVVLKEPLAA